MQLIEGVRVRCWQPEQGWAIGMLRLVVMLQAETPMTRWCFDVATGYPAENILEPTAIVHSDECVLPIRPIAAEDSLSASACQVDRQLAAIVQSLDINQSGLSTARARSGGRTVTAWIGLASWHTATPVGALNLALSPMPLSIIRI